MGTQNDTVDGGISEWTWGKRGPDPGQVLGATHLTGGSLSLLLRSLTHRLPFWDTVAESSTKTKKSPSVLNILIIRLVVLFIQ